MKRQVKSEPDARITQPQLIKQYNDGTGGVDVIDQLLGSYRSIIRGKKWYWPLIINAVNVSVVAAGRIHCAVAATPKSHLEFQPEIAICTMDVDKKTIGGSIANLPNDLRYDSVDYFNVSTTQGRCYKNTLYMCEKCSVRLHSDKAVVCFEMYHTRL